MARPKRKIAADVMRQIKVLAALGLSHEDIALVVGLPRRTMERRGAQALNEGRAQMRERLHRIQWSLATKSATMAIWLGKQYLGQRDLPLPDSSQGGAIVEYVHRIITTKMNEESTPN